MKRNLSISIVLSLILATADCGAASSHSPNATLAVASPAALGAGAAGIARAKSELLLAECRPCPDDEASLRGGLDPRIPYIISPRRTLLLTDKPVLRWNPVAGATSYTVSIVSEEGILWEQKDVRETQLVYPGVPPLKPGVEYKLIVLADSGASSEKEDGQGRSFQLLGAGEAKHVREAVDLLERQSLSGDDKALLQAYLYRGYYLRAEAIETLEKQAASGSKNPEVYRLLGDLYLQVGVTPLAEKNYMEAIQLYEAAGDAQRARELKERLEELKR